uniref:Secreted protein n=1 Tax=Ascaris lumbricoides TaxID=6252 RepID=A0A0M3IXN5_ASCLU
MHIHIFDIIVIVCIFEFVWSVSRTSYYLILICIHTSEFHSKFVQCLVFQMRTVRFFVKPFFIVVLLPFLGHFEHSKFAIIALHLICRRSWLLKYYTQQTFRGKGSCLWQ